MLSLEFLGDYGQGHPRLAGLCLADERVDAALVEQSNTVGPFEDRGWRCNHFTPQHGAEVDGLPSRHTGRFIAINPLASP